MCALCYETDKNRLDEGNKHIVLSDLVRLPDTVPKHNGPEHNFIDFYVMFKYILKTTLFAWRTYLFISSCDHDNIKTVLLLQYHDFDISSSKTLKYQKAHFENEK